MAHGHLMTHTYSEERLGIAAVQARAAKLHQIWRETPTGDFGIDGHMEFLRHNGMATGMMVGVQVKSGASYLQRDNGVGFLYTASEKHQCYWEQYPVPVLLVLHDSNNDQSYWLDVRQEFRSRKADNRTVLVPKSQVLQNSTAEELFANAGVSPAEYLSNIDQLLDQMLRAETRNARFDVSFFDLFCLGLTNIARSLYFGMDLALKIAEHKLDNSNSACGVSLADKEFNFLENYIRFLISQNLVHANYSDIKIDLLEHNLVPVFVVPLSSRGRRLVELISNLEDELVSVGSLHKTPYRSAQETFVEVVEFSMFPRFLRVDQVRKAILALR